MKDENNKIENILESVMQNISHLTRVETVIGSPVTVEGATVIPISRVTVGMLAGGGEYGDNDKKKSVMDDYAFAGGGGTGVSVSPIGFLVNDHKGMRVVRIDHETAYEKLLNLVPELITSLSKGGKK